MTVSVPASAAAANAVWISDAYGTVLDYTGSPTGTDIFTMPEGINDVKAHAAMGCMRVSDPTTFLTWQGLVDTFQSGNYDGFGGGGWSQSQIEEANLTLSADYAARASLPPLCIAQRGERGCTVELERVFMCIYELGRKKRKMFGHPSPEALEVRYPLLSLHLLLNSSPPPRYHPSRQRR